MRNSLIIKNYLFKIGAMSLCRRLIETKTVGILRYHAIVNPEDCYYASPGICISPEQFDNQIRFLSKKYNVISLDTVAACITDQRPFPPKAIVLTFDDGYRDNYLAYQILKKYDVTGTFYIVTECIGNKNALWLFEVIYRINTTNKATLNIVLPDIEIRFSLASPHEKTQAIRKTTEAIKSNTLEIRENIMCQLRDQLDDISDFEDNSSSVMLSWEQVKEMHANGMTIGGHTMTHLNLPNAAFEDAVTEISGCKETIEQQTGSEARHFSYPNGGNYDYYNDAIIKAVKDAGYMTSTTSKNGATSMQNNLLELKRIRVTSNISEIAYQMNCEPLVNKIRSAK